LHLARRTPDQAAGDRNVEWPGSAGGYPPAPPQIRTSRFPAYGSSGDGGARPWACGGMTGTSRWVSGYPGLFPAHTPSPDSSLPYSQAPAVSVRLLSLGTMKRLRLPNFSHRSPFAGLSGDTLVDSAVSLPAIPESKRPGQGVVLSGSPIAGLCSKDVFGSPMFPGNPIVLLPCSTTPAGPRRLAFTALRCCPRFSNNEGSSDAVDFGALSHGFGTGCLRFLPPSLATRQNSLPGVANLSGWDCSLPTEFR